MCLPWCLCCACRLQPCPLSSASSGPRMQASFLCLLAAVAGRCCSCFTLESCDARAAALVSWYHSTLTSPDGWMAIFYVCASCAILTLGVALDKGWGDNGGLTKAGLIIFGAGLLYWALRSWQDWATKQELRNIQARAVITSSFSAAARSLSSAALKLARRISERGLPPGVVDDNAAHQVCDICSNHQNMVSRSGRVLMMGHRLVHSRG